MICSGQLGLASCRRRARRWAAVREVLPEMSEQLAKQATTMAIACAAANHTRWFWGGVYG
jgi:hypothetical protein